MAILTYTIGSSCFTAAAGSAEGVPDSVLRPVRTVCTCAVRPTQQA